MDPTSSTPTLISSKVLRSRRLRRFRNIKSKGGLPIKLYSDRNKTYFYESICGIASYFCTSDIHNNFTIRRQPTYYYDAVETCKTENSSLISSKSASDIALAKDGFKIGLNGSPSKNPDIKTPLVA